MTALLTFLILHGWKQIDSMSLCICLAVAHRWLQNVVGTSVTNSPYDSCAIFLFLPHFDVICDLLLNKRTAQRKLCANYFIADVSKASLQTHHDVTSLDNKLRLLNSTWWSEQFEIPSKRSHLVFSFFKPKRQMYLPCPSFRPFGDYGKCCSSIWVLCIWKICTKAESLFRWPRFSFSSKAICYCTSL